MGQIIIILIQLLIKIRQLFMSKSKSQDMYKSLPKKPQAMTQSPKKQSEIQKYFKNLTNKTSSYQKTAKGAEQGKNCILKQIRKGELEIKQIPNDLGIILIKDKIDDEDLKEKQLNKKKQSILQALEKLDMRIHRQTQKRIENPQHWKYNPENILSKEEHEEIVQKMKKEQEQHHRRAEERLKLLQKQKQNEKEKLRNLQEEKLNAQRIIKRRQSQYKLSLRKQIRQLQESQNIRSNKELQEIKNKKFLHQKAQQDYEKSVLLPILEERKKKLKEIRDFSRAFDLQKIKEHQERYMRQRIKSMELLNSRTKISQQWLYKPPEKTEKLHKLLQQELSSNKKDLQKSKKIMQQKILRQQNYARLLKQKYVPKADGNLQKQIQSRIDSMYTRKRQPLADPNQVGKKYLQQVKQIVKSYSQSSFKTVSQNVSYTPSMQSSRINYLIRNNTDQFYLKKRNESLSKILQSKKQLNEKARELQIHNHKIEEQYKRKQQLLRMNAGTEETRNNAAELLLSGIKAKMGLIQLSAN